MESNLGGTKSYTDGTQFTQTEQATRAHMAETKRRLFGFMFSQIPATKVIRKHGQRERDVLLDEAKQLNNLKVFITFDARNMTNAERNEILG
mmetsp:Transcript_15865/g.15267  ORF Transcript_15865/g.15267 Transcript_15865/m.15267 type:complete len:92 (+) Transcript_15865:1022-1297(+)